MKSSSGVVPSVDYSALRDAIGQVHQACQARAATVVNQALTLRNWLIGAYIVEYEQNGADRAEYGEMLLARLAKDCSKLYGRGFARRNIELWRRLYLTYPMAQTLSAQSFRQSLANIAQTLFAQSVAIYEPTSELPQILNAFSLPVKRTKKAQTPFALLQKRDFGLDPAVLFSRLSWARLIEIIRIDDPLKRAFYEIETFKNNWSVRELKRQINSMLFERVGLSKDKQGVLELAKQGQLITQPSELFKDPYVLEFTGLAERPHYVESDLETALLNHLQRFLLELGHGFCFEARQQRVTVDGEHDYIDLVFYHRLLRCHVLIDLKIRKFRPADAGQMNFYLNFYRERVMAPGDSPPVGLILCTERDRVHVEYATAGLDNQVFVSRYLVTLPSVAQLERFLGEERDKLIGGLLRTKGHGKPGQLRRTSGRTRPKKR